MDSNSIDIETALAPPAVATGSEPSRRRLRLSLVALIVGFLGLGLGGFGIWKIVDLSKELDRVQGQLALSFAQQRDLDSQVTSLEWQLDDAEASLESQIDQGDATNARAVSGVQRDLADLDSAVRGFGGLESDIDLLTACVNAYMKTVGDAGGGRYYYFC